MDEGFPASRVLKYASITRSTYYYRLANPPKAKVPTGGRPIPGYSLNRKTKKKVKDTSIKVYLMQLIEGEEEIYGYRKLTKALRRKHHLIINKKKVYRLCKELDILMPQREKKQKHLRRLAKNRKITGPNQLWQVDIKYGYVMNSRRFFYLVSAIDVFDRKIVGYYLGKTCEATKVTKMLMKAMMKRGVKMTSAEEVGQGESRLIIRSDNGPQFISNHFQQFSEDKFEHERIPPKSPNMNAYIESFHSVLERECYQKNEFITFDHAFNTVDAYIEFYNNRRYHGSLNDYSPSEYYAKWLAKSMDPVELTM
ncbi:IS3 family transposase [Bacillus sp. THAF10]|uniref:IS3 family transposase n=1 Tax=Bacillus sp. THAF10 TaxID=2587848 RepID=UPI0020A6651E|nr:IS3 family transposase [Bacillus sp. THAF10]